MAMCHGYPMTHFKITGKQGQTNRTEKLNLLGGGKYDIYLEPCNSMLHSQCGSKEILSIHRTPQGPSFLQGTDTDHKPHQPIVYT